VWIYLRKIQGDLFSVCVHITVIMWNMYKMADFTWYTCRFEYGMAFVLCGVLINCVGWVVSQDYRKLGVWMPVQVGFL